MQSTRDYLSIKMDVLIRSQSSHLTFPPSRWPDLKSAGLVINQQCTWDWSCSSCRMVHIGRIRTENQHNQAEHLENNECGIREASSSVDPSFELSRSDDGALGNRYTKEWLSRNLDGKMHMHSNTLSSCNEVNMPCSRSTISVSIILCCWVTEFIWY